ncbi:MAG: glycosyl transferase [Ferruginibacter sp.]|nr:glycosyl transferase [Ferruginibacter sp.]
MRILYAIQGTGNGHICRAMEIVPLLKKHFDVDVLISGTESDVELPFEVQFRFHGLSFVFGKKGGINLLKTYKKSRVGKLLKEIQQLDVGKYNLVINDFEPVSSWACYLKGVPCVALSHQAAVLHPLAPRPLKNDLLGRSVLKHYAPASAVYGFHFQPYGNEIFTPVIRSAVRNQPVEQQHHFTVYLPAYSDENIIKMLNHFPNSQWQVFSKHSNREYKSGHVEVIPINNERFVRSMASSRGVVCGAGFETPAEALFLQKKLLVIPMRGQFEQQCNAAALRQMGVQVMKKFTKKHLGLLSVWIESNDVIAINYPDHIEEILTDIVSKHAMVESPLKKIKERKSQVDSSRFKKFQLKRILKEI